MQYLLMIHGEEGRFGKHAEGGRGKDDGRLRRLHPGAERRRRAARPASACSRRPPRRWCGRRTARPRCSTAPTPRSRSSSAAITSSRRRISTRRSAGRRVAPAPRTARSKCGRFGRCDGRSRGRRPRGGDARRARELRQARRLSRRARPRHRRGRGCAVRRARRGAGRMAAPRRARQSRRLADRDGATAKDRRGAARPRRRRSERSAAPRRPRNCRRPRTPGRSPTAAWR